jgi:ADP-heptose:LPS heptosyltransferase
VDHRTVPGVERVVVLRANGLGDTVVAEPALAALRAAYPHAHLTLVTSPPVADLLTGRPSVLDEVVAAPRVSGVRGETGGPPDDPPEVVEEFCARMRERRFDLGVQLHGGGGNANPLLLRFGARTTAGSRAPGAPALDRTVPWTSHQHDLLRWLEVVALVGAEPVRLRPRLAVTDADRAAAGGGGTPRGGGGRVFFLPQPARSAPRSPATGRGWWRPADRATARCSPTSGPARSPCRPCRRWSGCWRGPTC